MLDESLRNAIALKRFSLISLVINGQTKSNLAYYLETTSVPIEIPYYGVRNYSPKTLESWYCDYMKNGIDGLKPGLRGDIGSSRKIGVELGDKILKKKGLFPKVPNTLIYEM